MLMSEASTSAMPGSKAMPADGKTVHVSQKPLLTLRDFTNAHVTLTEGQIVLNVGLKPEPSGRWIKYTTDHVGSMIAFLVNDRVVMFAKILDPNDGKGFLVGPLDKAEADKLAEAINTADNSASCKNASEFAGKHSALTR
jgi:preprotein translocase subunit SecD